MKLSRREALKLGLASAAAASVAGCSRMPQVAKQQLPDKIEFPTEKPNETLRLVNRVAFGATPGELDRVAKIGKQAYIDEQLRAEESEPIALTFALRRLDVTQIDASELRDLPQEEIIRQLQQAAILRAVYNPNQLMERMVDFWTNHFNVYARKENTAYRVYTDQMQVIRKHALGKFRDIIEASTKSPAMLVYLDNQVNTNRGPNENYARELMELHTLGVHGGYTQEDVKEVARCYTGWQIENRFLYPRGKFRFNTGVHDKGSKRVLGKTIPANGGDKDVERVLNILVAHPSCAKFISYKLCRYFLGDAGSALEDQVAAEFTRTDGDIKAMVTMILNSDLLLSGPPIMKRPFDFLISSLRTFATDTDGNTGIQGHLDKIGQPLYQWPMPDGYPDKTDAWTSSLLARWNYSLALTAGAIPGTKANLEDLVERMQDSTNEGFVKLTHGHIDPVGASGRLLSELRRRENLPIETGQSILHETAALCIAAPGFQWR
ncbi:MAG: DUF1800 domain-containing protein [Fimbriimonadaceae bacterium]|nr:DUF1800 domain-containing protein [Fimbriimonadaceae bacterium]